MQGSRVPIWTEVLQGSHLRNKKDNKKLKCNEQIQGMLNIFSTKDDGFF